MQLICIWYNNFLYSTLILSFYIDVVLTLSTTINNTTHRSVQTLPLYMPKYFIHDAGIGPKVYMKHIYFSVRKSRCLMSSQKRVWFTYLMSSQMFSHTSESNPLHAKVFRGDKNIHLHFMSFLHIDMTQVLKILPPIRPGPIYST